MQQRSESRPFCARHHSLSSLPQCNDPLSKPSALASCIADLLSSVEADAAPPTNPSQALLMDPRATDARARFPAARLSWNFAVSPQLASQSDSLLFSSWLRSKPVLAKSSWQGHRQSTAHAKWLLPCSLPMIWRTSRPHILGWAAAQWRSLSSAASESSNAMSRTVSGELHCPAWRRLSRAVQGTIPFCRFPFYPRPWLLGVLPGVDLETRRHRVSVTKNGSASTHDPVVARRRRGLSHEPMVQLYDRGSPRHCAEIRNALGLGGGWSPCRGRPLAATGARTADAGAVAKDTFSCMAQRTLSKSRASDS